MPPINTSTENNNTEIKTGKITLAGTKALKSISIPPTTKTREEKL